VSKAKGENIKFEEINFIAKMTKDIQKLDIENKMIENEERRRAHLLKVTSAQKRKFDLRKQKAEEQQRRGEEAK